MTEQPKAVTDDDRKLLLTKTATLQSWGMALEKALCELYDGCLKNEMSRQALLDWRERHPAAEAALTMWLS